MNLFKMRIYILIMLNRKIILKKIINLKHKQFKIYKTEILLKFLNWTKNLNEKK